MGPLCLSAQCAQRELCHPLTSPYSRPAATRDVPDRQARACALQSPAFMQGDTTLQPIPAHEYSAAERAERAAGAAIAFLALAATALLAAGSAALLLVL